MNAKRRIKKLLKRASGVSQLEGEINTLHYFLNSYADITSVPVATGDLRALQICDLRMMEIYDKLCRMFNLRYWLDYGSLLGAVRHEGFIPWDDDVDVSMVRSDWNEASKLIVPELEKLGFYVRVYSESWFGFGLDRDNTGLWMDVFCYERFVPSDDKEESLQLLDKEIQNQLRFARKRRTFNTQPRITREQMRRNREKTCYWEGLNNQGAGFYFLSPEIQSDLSLNVYSEDDLFPLVDLPFEDTHFPAPSNWHKFLIDDYGSYMHFPKDGVLHHGLEGCSLKDIAKSSGTDMRQVEVKLNGILQHLDAS